MGMQDNRVTALLVAANVLCFGMQQISTTFTSYCVRVSTSPLCMRARASGTVSARHFLCSTDSTDLDGYGAACVQPTNASAAMLLQCNSAWELRATACCAAPQIGYKVAAGEYWRLLTAAFVHANVLHVGVSGGL